MVAGFVAGIIQKDIIHAFKLAVACGTSTAYSLGLSEYDSIMELYKKIKINELNN